MRAPQRKFVVEFKSRSRKSKVNTPTSIWGDTDLKAVSRELEEQSGSLFASPAGAPAFRDAKPAGMKMQAVLPVFDDPSFPVAAPSLSCLAADTTTKAAPALAADAEDKRPLPAEPVAAAAGRPGKPLAATKRKAPVLRTEPRQPAGGKKEETHVTRADLDGLIAQNTRLKAELRERLTADNRRLREMLIRFS